ncbi:hypothetical protein ACFORG_11480 [Lutimaribacter marinistellae]|uniref:Uncharacterized protein n=1 Tax=Lutimaribacter marinistellae TaxID=1820329 RepID=A0ABV7TGE9_9RHOB
MTLSGWANSPVAGLESLGVSVSRGDRVEIPMELQRPDVTAAYPLFTREACGFDALVQAPGMSPEKPATLEFDIRFTGGEEARLACDLEFAEGAAER